MLHIENAFLPDVSIVHINLTVPAHTCLKDYANTVFFFNFL